jgi:flagellar L-ring protein precursor FlgH
MFNKSLIGFCGAGCLLAVGTSSAALAQMTGSIFPGSASPAPYAAATYRSYLTDRIAGQIGDLVTITVDVRMSAQKQASTKTAKDSTVKDAITQVLFPYSKDTPDTEPYMWTDPITKVTQVKTRPIIRDGWTFPFNSQGANPQMAWAGAQEFDGNGKMAQSDTMTTTIQARVIEALPNGTLRLEARRTLENGREKGDMILTGLVRREDISASNSVSSTRVADLQIRQEGSGPLSRATRKGWLTSLYEFLNPF